ncbi:hypothetical protein KJ693_02460 [bacterium]|nr:hypothetical protein [bacterium]MBU1614153.1 hypothetical protein [bacterium]
MSKTVAVSEELYGQLKEISQTKKQTPDILVQKLLSHYLNESYREKVKATTKALISNSSLPSAGNWADIEAALSHTASPFPTIEEAMSYSRGRRWIKDNQP